jgi:hypothetical protein
MVSLENKQNENTPIVFTEYEELKEPEKNDSSKIDFSKLKGVVLDAEILKME